MKKFELFDTRVAIKLSYSTTTKHRAVVNLLEIILQKWIPGKNSDVNWSEWTASRASCGIEENPLSHYYMKSLKRSFSTLQMGQVSGGCSLAQRYPHTLHRQTGNNRPAFPSGKLSSLEVVLSLSRIWAGSRRSGMDLASDSPLSTPCET